MMGVLWERVVAVMVEVAPLRFAKGRISPPLPSFPRTRESRDIRTTVYLAPLWLARSACAGAAWFVFLWVPASAGMTWLSRE